MMEARLLPETKISVLEKQTLRRQLDEYYGQAVETDYVAFSQPSNQIDCWVHIGKELDRLGESTDRPIQVLEIGAGRSGFGQWLTACGMRDRVFWSVQDVTRQNSAWLESQADEVFYKDVSKITPNLQFDIVFSTYVFEHITDPARHLDHLYRFLRPGGSLFIFCPRYDVPGYSCPGSRHLSWYLRLNFEVQRLRARWASWLHRRPAFLIQTDVAAFHTPYFIDADAVHWVSLMDLKYWARGKGASIRQLDSGMSGTSTKNYIVRRWLTCSVKIQKSR